MEDTSRPPSPSPSSISTRSSSESDTCSEIQDTTESDSGDDEMLAKLRASFVKKDSGAPISVDTIKNEDSKPVKLYPIFQQPMRSISTQPNRINTDKGGTQNTIELGSTSIKNPNSSSPPLVSGPKSVMINLQSPSSRHSGISVIPIQIKTNTKRPVSPDIVEEGPYKRKVKSKLDLKAEAGSSTTPSWLGNVERSNKICEEAVKNCSTLRDIRKHLIKPQNCRNNHFEKVQNLYRPKQFHPRQIEVPSKLDIHQPLDSHAGSSSNGTPKNELSSINSFFKRLLVDARSLPLQETFCVVTDLFPTLNQTVISPKSTASQLEYLASQPISPKIPHFTYPERNMLNLVPDCDKKSLRHLELESQSFVTGKIDCLIKPDCLKKEPLDEHPGGSIKLEPMCLQSPAEMKYSTSTSSPTLPSETENVNFKNGFILDYLREEKIKADTIIQLKDGSIGAHRLVLASVSPFLGALLLDQADKSMCRIMIPDIRVKTMKKIIEFIYTGKLNYKPKEGLKIQAALHLLRLMACTGYHVTKIEPEVQPENIESLGNPNQIPEKEEEERLKLVLPPPPGPETKITDIFDSTSITLQEQENKVESQGLPQDPNNFYSVTRNKDFICNFCSKRFKSLSKLFLHFDAVHKEATVLHVSEEEMKIITKCDFCHKQCQSPGAAHECLKKHGYIRCWSCLETFDRELIRQHYLIHHVDERSKDDARNTYVKCRWCHHLLIIKSNLGNLTKHACSHLDDCPKTGRKRRYTESIDVSDESPKESEKQRNDDRINAEGQVQYRTLNLKGTEVFQLRAAIISPSAPPRFVMNERGKVDINFRKLPKPSCQIPEIPKELVKLLRKNKND